MVEQKFSNKNKKPKNKVFKGNVRLPSTIRQPLHSVIASVWKGYYASSIYQKTLDPKRSFDKIQGFPIENLCGDANNGHALIFGEMIMGGYVKSFSSMSVLKTLEDKSPSTWIEGVHSFTWIRDLQAVATYQSSKVARSLTEDWINIYSNYHPVAWQSNIIARRVLNIFGVWSFIHDQADAPFRLRLRKEIIRQTNHLIRNVDSCEYSEDRIICYCAIIWASMHLFGDPKVLRSAVSVLIAELSEQVNEDGGHKSCSPRITYKILRHLVDLSHNLSYNRIQIPPNLTKYIAIMTKFIRSIRHSDGTLPLFHDSHEEYPAHIDLLLNRSRVASETADLFKDTGFICLKRETSVVILDGCAAPKRKEFSSHFHNSVTSFEFSTKSGKLICNAGAELEEFNSKNLEKRYILQSSRAHSCLTVQNEELSAKSFQVSTPRVVVQQGRVLGSVSHMGWSKQGWIHQRNIWLSDDGLELIGQDRVKLNNIKKPIPNHNFILRFYVDPQVKIEQQPEYNGVLMFTSSETWYFDFVGKDITIGRGTWFGRPNDNKAINCISIVAKPTEVENMFNWRIYQVS